jgi:hypothetical protein
VEQGRDVSPGARAALLLAVGVNRDHDASDLVERQIAEPDSSARSWLEDEAGNALWAAGELGRTDRSFAERVLGPARVHPTDAYVRGLAWLGLGKARAVLDRAAFEAAMEAATENQEKTLIATGAAFAGVPDFLPAALQAIIADGTVIYLLRPQLERDLITALKGHAGEGGKAVALLHELGDFT